MRRLRPARATAGPDVAAQSLRCPPSLLRQSSAFEKEGRSRGSCIYWPTAAPLVRNSPRGWAPKTLPIPEVHAGRADKATPPRLPARRPTALLPADRIVVRDLGVHPRCEFRTSGAAVGQIST